MSSSRSSGCSSARAARAFLVACTALLAGPSTARADPDPASTHPPDPPASSAPEARRPLVWIGASLFALSYLASAADATTGYTTDDGETSARAVLWVPIVGPFVRMGDTRSGSELALLALDGLAQIGGLTMFVYGLAAPKTARSKPAALLDVSIVPLVAPGLAGSAIVAKF